MADHAFGPGSERPFQPPGAPVGARKKKSSRLSVASVTPSGPGAGLDATVRETFASGGTPATVISHTTPPTGVGGTKARSAGEALVSVSGSTACAGADA